MERLRTKSLSVDNRYCEKCSLSVVYLRKVFSKKLIEFDEYFREIATNFENI